VAYREVIRSVVMGAAVSPQVIGRYAIFGKIASGGMASVHFGRLYGGAGFSRTVAIKRLHPHLAEDPEFVSTMIDEARLAARIHHPNVVPTLDVVAADGEVLVVMEYVRGESLSRLLKIEAGNGRRVPLPIVSAIVTGALHGLHAAHEAKSDRGAPLGIVHRDVSPQNVLVGVDGMARVIDFGVAKAAGRLQTTREGVVKGKMAYMAPEQVASGEVTRSADLYAMGVLLWETLTGKRLFQAESEAALVAVVLGGAKAPPSIHAPDVSPELDALVMKALAPDPDLRFQSAADMAATLASLVPPALQTEVGRWVEEAARDGLARRGAIVSEIESSSGFATVPPTSLPVRSPKQEDEAPTVASQPSSLSVETPRPGVLSRGRSRVLWVALLGGGLLAMGSVAVLRGRGTPATATSPSVTGAPSVAAASSPVPPSATVLAAPPDTASGTPSSDPAPVPPPARPAPPAPRVPGATASPAAPRPKAKCNPPYVIDSAGFRQYKPECL
jgi:serine/threonine-protein kinase